MPQLNGSYFSITSNKSALARKNMHSPLFSKEAVRRSENLVTDMVAKFLKVISGYASVARPVDLSMGFSCLAADVAMNYVFQKTFNALDSEEFQSDMVKATDANIATLQWPIHFPKVFAGFFWVTTCLPRWIVSRFMKPLALIDSCLEVSATRPLQCYSIGSMAYHGMNRYAVSKSPTYKSALPARGVYVRCSISTSTPTSRKDNSRLRLMR